MTRWMIAALLLTAGCADTTRIDLDRRLSGLVGAPEAELVRRLDGPPTRVTEAGGVKYLAYYQSWPDFVLMGPRPAWAPPFNTPGLIDRYCEITYAVRDGRVAGYNAEGNSCGWGGYPVIKPA